MVLFYEIYLFFSWSFLCFSNVWTYQLRSIFIFQTSKSDANIWKQLKSKLQEIFAKNWEDREVEDSHTIERILYLSRNILHIPPNAQDQNRAPGEDTVIFFSLFFYDFIPNWIINVFSSAIKINLNIQIFIIPRKKFVNFDTLKWENFA